MSVADVYVFVGPYIECLSSSMIWLEENDPLDKEWAKLLDDHKRMDWAMPGGNPQTLKVGKKELWQYCGVPLQRRRAARWPMFFRLSIFDDGESFDWVDVEPKAEIEWFTKAYAKELELLGKIFPTPPVVKWGLLYWSGR
jgi:hypothetical protein